MNSSFVYRIRCLTTGKSYYGSTSLPIKQRMQIHIHQSNQYTAGLRGHVCSSHECIVGGNYECRVISECVGLDKVSLHIIEDAFIADDASSVNKRLAHMSAARLVQLRAKAMTAFKTRNPTYFRDYSRRRREVREEELNQI